MGRTLERDYECNFGQCSGESFVRERDQPERGLQRAGNFCRTSKPDFRDILRGRSHQPDRQNRKCGGEFWSIQAGEKIHTVFVLIAIYCKLQFFAIRATI